MTEITDDHIINVDTIQNAIEKRRTSPWYSRFRDFYDGLIQVSNMQDFFRIGRQLRIPTDAIQDYLAQR